MQKILRYVQYLFFHEALLNNARHTVGIALSDLIQALKTPPPTQEKIDKAKGARTPRGRAGNGTAESAGYPLTYVKAASKR
jgi:hypothetical protein